MKLIDILVQELPKRGGWPDGGVLAVQDYDKWICFSAMPEVEISGLGEWGNPDGDWVSIIKNCEHLAEDYSKSIITREQYEAALAASKPEWDGEGLPPPGVEFEYLRGNFGADKGRWFKCTMKYAGEKYCIVHLDGEGESWLKHEGTQIRPIRSEEDKKKEEAIKAIDDAQSQVFDQDSTFSEYLYDAIAAGKIPHIRID